MTDDEPLLQVRIPALGIDDGCLFIVGGLGGTRGFSFFPSVQDYEQMIEGAAAAWPCARPAPHCALYFSFEAARDVAEQMRKEVTARGWALADEAAYPILQRVMHGLRAAVAEPDLRLATALMHALCALIKRDERVYPPGEKLHERHSDESGLEVILTLPHPTLHFDDASEGYARAPTLSASNAYQLPLERAELESLAHVLRSLTLHWVMGMFCAVCSVPLRGLSPLTWLTEIIGQLPPGSEQQRRCALDQLVVVYEHVVATSREHTLHRLVPEPADAAACSEWAHGYARLLCRVAPSELEADLLDAVFSILALAKIPEALAQLEEFRGDESRADALARYRESLASDAHYLFQAWDHARARHERFPSN
jgi:hypothetical protein